MKNLILARPMPVAAIIFALFSAGLGAGLAQAQTPPNLTRAEAREVARICRSDVRSLCDGIEPGNGRIAACLRANSERLSEPCKAKLTEILNR
ncbi:cysteine rich repeat-containing protein [Aurantimonas sp. 22II-16-19i]|uniref:cysteine rich repeat-containing protein n=1 Tax=Aurantimonas sp. 22II-16-19i TaxID=1317114 RepID=UPI0009F7E220|nr:cysteine rich repeat-containing protein [Aurantimonas sp. 22II-16-19i]ORE98153.1 hypothetical protein ATO4_06149 [Aurantimonas sp. 22II-16-19i]